jgi:rhodanese-related sulfurtransferase
MGYGATALEGGFDAWKALYPTEEIASPVA